MVIGAMTRFPTSLDIQLSAVEVLTSTGDGRVAVECSLTHSALCVHVGVGCGVWDVGMALCVGVWCGSWMCGGAV